MKKSETIINTTKMTNYLTWKEMYQRAYDPQYMDLGYDGMNSARALRQFDLLGEQHPLTRQVSHSHLERAFFAMGDECTRVNSKLWNFAGNRPKQTDHLATMTLGAMSGFATTLTLLYALQ